MQRIQRLMDLAEKSAFRKLLLQMALGYAIPFNRPHGFKVKEVFSNGIHIALPYWRVNRNHINGIHACALATLSEFVSGLTLTRALRRDDLRLIMKDLKVTYHYQAKKDVSATAQIDADELEKKITIPLKNNDSIFYLMQIDVYDTDKNHICTAEINWQLKKWNKVKTT